MWTHGKKSSYIVKGCRCSKCREAWTADRRKVRAARRASYEHGEPLPAHVVHGRRSTYNNWCCRCSECKKSKAKKL